MTVEQLPSGRSRLRAGLGLLDPRTGVNLARLAVTASVRVTGAAVRGSVAAGADLVREVNAGEPVGQIVDRRADAMRSAVVRALGLDGRVVVQTIQIVSDTPSVPNLRAQGDALLRRLSDPDRRSSQEHPAFARILQEMLPDEARILRFLALGGPQPAIDVRSRAALGSGSELIATGINLVADMAGCSEPERNQQYLANLIRLGMVRLCDEPVEDLRRYSFVEAQPVAAAALARARRSLTVHRSIGITMFGRQFCEVCFTLDGYDAGGWLEDRR